MKIDWRLEHINHHLCIIHGNFGKHHTKIICKDCNNKWLSWLPKNFKAPKAWQHIEIVYDKSNPRPKPMVFNTDTPSPALFEAVKWNSYLKSSEYTQRRITFGRYIGTQIKDLPLEYIKWGIMNFNTTWAGYLARELQRREPKWKK